MITEYLVETAEIAAAIDGKQIARMITELSTVRAGGGRLFLIGNGGGAGHASHAAADFRKIAHLESYAWGENVSDLTAYVNDEGWACSTSRWLEDSKARKGDAILVFSVGGASREVSENLKEAIFWAKNGPTVLGIVGQEGGYLERNADACVIIPSTDTPHVEGFQAVLWHLLVTALR